MLQEPIVDSKLKETLTSSCVSDFSRLNERQQNAIGALKGKLNFLLIRTELQEAMDTEQQAAAMDFRDTMAGLLRKMRSNTLVLESLVEHIDEII